MSKFIQTHFFHPSTFLLPTKQKGEKIKYFLSSHFFIISPFSILPFFHPSNQTDLKRINLKHHYSWRNYILGRIPDPTKINSAFSILVPSSVLDLMICLLSSLNIISLLLLWMLLLLSQISLRMSSIILSSPSYVNQKKPPK